MRTSVRCPGHVCQLKTIELLIISPLQLELNAFRAQWMSELNPNAGETGSGKGLSRASDLRMAQEAARERKVR